MLSRSASVTHPAGIFGNPNYRGPSSLAKLVYNYNNNSVWSHRTGTCNLRTSRPYGRTCRQNGISWATELDANPSAWSVQLPAAKYSLHKSLLAGGIPTTLKNMSSSVGIIIPNIWKNKKMFQTTNQDICLFATYNQGYHSFMPHVVIRIENKKPPYRASALDSTPPPRLLLPLRSVWPCCLLEWHQLTASNKLPTINPVTPAPMRLQDNRNSEGQ